ncbi:hypothetical protein P152DRAFT_471732 [Eremomyces bilateralis CBS 781.70]|uniref:Cyclin-domain-containing protein n=1 Tax=Eremomyces bilateralis CBS 781.70 TaxID=1392243 RepID=A0A6G1GAI0_9PEZI|nr:uncharacterized protein P152DRAFT_471732 [Eremomyces bilateralis CBS 781.70]KAF1815097.1 hypothetical protein P152DRAFT_471732 [Eremomyces bilateralis CBS 781.70]
MYGVSSRGYGQSSGPVPTPMADGPRYTTYRSAQADPYRQPENLISRPYQSASASMVDPIRRSPLQHGTVHSTTVDGPNERRKNLTSLVAPSLQIPPEINVKQLGMPQLAAEVTCLFWFEDSTLLQKIQSADREVIPTIAQSLLPEARPSTGFTKWVATILSTTQVTQNVVMLALLFIYRLKHINPMVKGKPGSEFRLLTVALMLGNKFLDDNTYTNKTWAEVSGISVQEVHVMEVEFLSNMRYSLYASETHWAEWKAKLGKFGDYFYYASLARQSTPRGRGLPSPPVSAHTSPPSQPGYHFPPAVSSTPIILPQMRAAAVSPIRPLPELDGHFGGQKRGYEEHANIEPPAKRQELIRSIHSLPTPVPAAASNPQRSLPPLPVPNLSIQTPQSNHFSNPLVPQLPPPGRNAMSLVFPPQSQSQLQPPTPYQGPGTGVNVPSSMGTSLPPLSIPPHVPPLDLRPPPRNLSPYPPGSTSVSPVSATFANSSGNVTPTHSQPPTQHFTPGSSSMPPSTTATALPPSHLSPSYFLAQRSSPYRPIRAVQTLLVPPPSGMMGAIRNSTSQPSSGTLNSGIGAGSGLFPSGYGQSGSGPEPRLQYRSLGRNFSETKWGRLPYVGNWGQTSQPQGQAPGPGQHQGGSYSGQPYGWQQTGPTGGGSRTREQRY